jgi:hypoxanthine phosphoribosyltransferase
MKNNDTAKQNQKNLTIKAPSWNHIHNLLIRLATRIKKSGFKPDIIVGVSRGGWIPARIMSDILENNILANVSVEFYVDIGKSKQKPTITQPISTSVKNMKVLVVDDLADSGESLKLVKAHLEKQGAQEIRIATIYFKPWSIVVPNYYEKQTQNWIVFPWEQKEAARKILETKTSQGGTVQDSKEKLIRFGLNRKLVEQFINEIIEEKE